MRRILFSFFVIQCCLLCAQVPYTDQLQKSTGNQGTVIIHQSQVITDMVNGTTKPLAVPSTTQTKTEKQVNVASTSRQDTVKVQPVSTSGQKVRANGYRIQVYSGGNSRQAKNEAMLIQNKVKNLYAGLPVYTHFQSPHWICRVGDFRTYEEANEVFTQMKGTFSEAVIVRSKVNVYY